MTVLVNKPIKKNSSKQPVPTKKDEIDYEEMARQQGIKPIEDVQAWLASLPVIDDGGELYEAIMRDRRERRALVRQKEE